MSRRYAALQKEVEALREHFLPKPFNPLGTYPNSRRVQAHAGAFLVLSHAEFESYLEDWAKDLTRACEVLWGKSGRVAMPLAHLLGISDERIGLPKSLTAAGAKDSSARLGETLVALFQDFYGRIKANNGIKESNVVSLFAPLGIPSAAFTPTLLPNLDALGSKRGTHAHVSRAVVAALDAETEYKLVISVLTDLKVFDDALVEYRRKIR